MSHYNSLKNIFVIAANEGEVWKGWAGECLMVVENIRHMLCTEILGTILVSQAFISRAKSELSCVDQLQEPNSVFGV